MKDCGCFVCSFSDGIIAPLVRVCNADVWAKAFILRKMELAIIVGKVKTGIKTCETFVLRLAKQLNPGALSGMQPLCSIFLLADATLYLLPVYVLTFHQG